MEIVLLMAGANVWGRMVAHKLAPLNPTVINESGTKRAAKISQWLAPEYGHPLGDHIETDNLLADIPECDYLINGGCGVIFKADILNHAKHGLLNAHPGYLPDYRGLDPVCWAVSRGDPQGATVHFMDEGIDTGPILIRRRFDTVSKEIVPLRLEVMETAADMVLEFLTDPGKYPPQPQDPEEGNYFGAFEHPEGLNAILRL